MTVRTLSFHAGYRCRHRGRCCTSGWPIPVDPSEAADAGIFDTPPAATGPTLLSSVDGKCVFYSGRSDGGCQIHRALGHASLPLACRQFPRQSLHDPRGVSVTLSHYCPTAQDMLVNSVEPVSIVENPVGFPSDGEYVGLTADADLPPLLHPTLAMDWESWWLFEAESVALIAGASNPLVRLGLAVEYTRDWTVGSRPLTTHVRESFVRARHADVAERPLPSERINKRVADAVSAIPDRWRAIALDTLSIAGDAEPDEGVARRFLAAHAFASWAACQGEGLRTWFRSIETAASLLTQTRDPGGADLILRHLADNEALVDRWKAAEAEPALPTPRP